MDEYRYVVCRNGAARAKFRTLAAAESHRREMARISQLLRQHDNWTVACIEKSPSEKTEKERRAARRAAALDIEIEKSRAQLRRRYMRG